MENRRNYSALFAAGFFVLIAGCAYLATRRSPEDIAKAQLKAAAQKIKKKAQSKLLETVGDANIEGGELSGSDAQGRPLWSVGAEKIESKMGQGEELTAILTDAHATLYQNGVAETNFRSAKMKLTRDANEKVKLVLSGGVSAKTSSQAIAQIAKTTKSKAKNPQLGASLGALEMQSQDAEIDIDTRHLVAKNGVTMTQGVGAKAIKVTAPHLVADVGLANAQLTGGIVATAEQGTFKAPSATWNWKNHRIAATGGVSATHEQTVLTGARLDADTQAKTGTVSGDVKIKAPQGSAGAPSVNYNWGAGRIAARGGVILSKDNGSVRASSIECDDKLQNAFASGGVTLQKEGVRLTANSAKATNGLARASASGDVTITKDDVTLRAASIQSFDNFAHAEASGAVHLTKGKASLRARNVEVFDKGTRAKASGGVTLVQDDVTVSANRAEATNLSQKGALRIVANGDVRLKQADAIVTASYVEGTHVDSENARRITATGNVRAENSSGWVRASRVTWGGGKVSAAGGVSAKRGELTLSADNFAGDDKGENAVLTGHVIVKHSNGATLQAPNGRYAKNENKVFANGGIVYKDAQGSVMKGKSLVANLKLQQAQISGLEGKVNLRALEGKNLF